MTSTAEPSDRLQTLLAAMFDGQLADEQAEELRLLLHDDPTALREYVRQAITHSALQWVIASPEGPSEIKRADDDRSEEGDSSTPNRPVLTIPTLSDSAPPGVVANLFSEWTVPYVVSAMILGVGILIASFAYVSHPQRIAGNLPSNNQGALSSQSTNNAVGRITGMVDCRWERKQGLGIRDWGLDEGSRPKDQGSRFKQLQSPTSKSRNPQIPKSLVCLGDQLVLSAGLMEITYNTGAKVILQGPCTYEVDSAAGGYLEIGKLTARVEQSTKYGVRSTEKVASDGLQNANCKLQNAKMGEVSGQWLAASESSLTTNHYPLTTTSNPQSLIPNPPSSHQPLAPSPSSNPLFTIKTPTAVVTDLGTEFGVEVDKQGRTTSHVFCGSVRVQALAADGHPHGDARILHENQSANVELREGHAPLVTLHTLARSDNPSFAMPDFVRALPATKRAADLDPYAKIVLAMQPAVYYRMEKPINAGDDLLVRDATPNARDARLHLGTDSAKVWPWLSGRHGNALWLRGSVAGDYALADRLPDGKTNQLSFSAWILAEGTQNEEWPRIACEDGPRPWRFEVGLYDRDGDLSAVVCQAGGRNCDVREGRSHPLPLDAWQHVAFVADGSRLILYRNGIEVASTPCEGVISAPAPKYLTIGCSNKAENAADLDPRNFWNGRIDELAVFHRALSPEEIKQLSCQREGSFE